jgi:hypothetical protein
VLACIAVLFQGIVNTLLGVLLLSLAQTSSAQFAGGFVLVWGIVMGFLGVFVVRKAQWALIGAVVICIMTLLLTLVTNPVSAIILAALFLTPMIGGLNALSKMKTLEAAGHAVPTW